MNTLWAAAAVSAGALAGAMFRDARARLRHWAATRRDERCRWAAWDANAAPVVAAWRAELASARAARETRSAGLAQTARGLRPIAADTSTTRRQQ